MKIYPSLWMIVFLLFIPNCRSVGSEPPTASECGPLVTSFFQLSAKEQATAFSALDLDRQYVTYICGMKSIHPPALHLALEFAEEGKVAFPFLATQLRKTQEDSHFRYIVYVFRYMQRLQTYDVVAEKDLMLYLKQRTNEVRDEFWRNEIHEILARMVSPHG
jgi:hypothetical protein